MRIAVIGPMDPDSFADNVSDTLVRMGHDVTSLGATRPDLPVRQVTGFVTLISDQVRTIDKVRQRPLCEQVTELRPDLVLTTDRRLHPTVISAAHRVGARVALWFPDHTGTMANHDMFVAGYDRIYLKNPDLAHELASIQGLPVAYMPEAANREWHHPHDLAYGTDRAIIVAGNIHPTRAVLLERLLADGFPLRIFGALPTWVESPRVRDAFEGTSVTRHEKARVFRSSRAVLNNLHPAENRGMNCRLFEAAACGAAVVTEDRGSVGDYFVPGREVLAFSSYDELVEQFALVLDDVEAGRRVADAGSARALAEYTYEHRLREILADLF